MFKGRRVFLFEQALVITKQRRDNEGTYIIKEQFMVSMCGVGDPLPIK